MSENTTAYTSHPFPDVEYDPYEDLHADFPPNFETSAQGFGFLFRFVLVGIVIGALGALAAFSLAWWLSVAVLVVWVVGVLVAGIVSPLCAKKHRAGFGYPADGASWARSFAFTLPIVAAVAGAIGIIAAASSAIVLAGPGGSPNYTPAILLGVVTVLAVAGLRWAAVNQLHWLVYGRR